MPYKTKAERKEASRRHYERNKQNIVERTRQRRIELRKWLIEYKVNRGCQSCGAKHPAVLDLHHENGEKERGLSDCANSSFSFKRLLAEVEKCTVLCSNCHRIKHWNESHLP